MTTQRSRTPLRGGPLRRRTPPRLSLRGGRGYTLIELLVVCALVAIVAALAIPSYSVTRRMIYNNVALRDLVQARTAVQGQVSTPKNGTSVIVGPAAFPGAASLRVSRNVRLTIVMSTPAGNGSPRFTITSTHTLGTATYTVSDTSKITTNVGKLP